MHNRSNPWASDWLKRYDKRSMEGLKTIQKSGIKYHYTHIYRLILRKWGFKQKVPRKVHVILHPWMKCYLFMDKALQHHKSKKVLKYFEENKDTLIPVYLPTTASPDSSW
jgi:hypothetical protein